MAALLPKPQPRVLVAMSGGVDSSVAAYLLQKQGYEVIGVTFQLYDYARQNRKEGKGGCCSLEDIDDAKSVCSKLGIPHYLFDSRERFQKWVVNYFADSYKAGRTPNPCVACNTFIKFDELAYYANAVGADFYATGHYVRIRRDGDRIHLQAATDPNKDQSYFLMGVQLEKLEKCLFPVGELSKDEVRSLAEEAGLKISQKPDSMEVCFVPENDYRKFLKNEYKIEDAPGFVVNEEGRVLAQHSGVHNFTVGQKKGLGPMGLHDFYVLRLNAETREVVVGLDKALFSEGLVFEGSHFLDAAEYFRRPLQVKIRSRSAFIEAQLVGAEGSHVKAQFMESQRAVTPGQFAVFYDEHLRLLGGGPILRPVANF